MFSIAFSLYIITYVSSHHNQCGESVITFDAITGQRCGAISTTHSPCGEHVTILNRDHIVPAEPQRYLPTINSFGNEYAFIDDLRTAHLTSALWHEDFAHIDRNDTLYHDADSIFMTRYFPTHSYFRDEHLNSFVPANNNDNPDFIWDMVSCRNSREMGLISSDPNNDFCAKLYPVAQSNPICSNRAVYVLPDQNDEIGSTVVAWASGDNGCRSCSTMDLNCSSDFCYCRVYFSAPFWEA